ncbi:MAG: GspH/FimT family pseudopilin [Proteobacteria bacterium]|nr:GspH/FimT family pseudopilin [Pseudomonadota bacterium]
MKNENGVTLVEVMSCLVILSVLSGIATPLFKDMMSKQALYGATSMLVSELHKARSYAMRSNSHVAFSYTEDGYKAFIDDGQGGGTEGDWIQQPGEQVLANVDLLKDRLKIAVDESTFTAQRTRFSGRPGIKAGAIVLQGNDGRKNKIIVNFIGRVRVEKL